MDIAGINIESPFVLAPLAGVNCAAFRIMCKEQGAGLVYTQMYHSGFLKHKLDSEGFGSIRRFINIHDAERPVSIQIVGHDPDEMALAAKTIEPIADLIDINFGCPDDNMIKAGAGSWFLKYPEKMIELTKKVVDSVKKPVTVKIRIGWDSQNINGVKCAAELEKTGIAGIAVHGRTAVQKYAGKANWEIIKHIKSRLSIPVIGNGDAKNAGKAIEMLKRTGCDSVMIGRRAIGDPGFFRRCSIKYKGNTSHETITPPKELFLRFAEYYKRYDKNKSFTELRTHALWFSKRAALGSRNRAKIADAKTIDEIMKIWDNTSRP